MLLSEFLFSLVDRPWMKKRADQNGEMDRPDTN